MAESNKMKDMPVNKLMIQMGIPMILSMALQAVYNIVDSAFVGNMRVGSEAALNALMTYYDAERTAFSIINRYVRFVDKEADKKRSDWKLSVRWAWFIGENIEPLKLTTKPEPYTLDRTLRWIQRQVDPTLKMLETITAKTGIDYLKEIRKSTKLTEKHYKIIEQQTTSTEDVILEKEN